MSLGTIRIEAAIANLLTH